MLDEKIDVLIGRLSNCDLRTSVGVYKASRVLRRALKEQDRDTRYACANATANALSFHSYAGETANKACINVKAV
jgi:hypothetical protein